MKNSAKSLQTSSNYIDICHISVGYRLIKRLREAGYQPPYSLPIDWHHHLVEQGSGPLSRPHPSIFNLISTASHRIVLLLPNRGSMSSGHKDTAEPPSGDSSKQPSVPQTRRSTRRRLQRPASNINPHSQLLPKTINSHPIWHYNVLVTIFRRSSRKWFPNLLREITRQKEVEQIHEALGEDVEGNNYQPPSQSPSPHDTGSEASESTLSIASSTELFGLTASTPTPTPPRTPSSSSSSSPSSSSSYAPSDSSSAYNTPST